MMAEAQTQKDTTLPGTIIREKSCDKCAHLPVCVYFRATTSVVQKHSTEETAPFKPENLAMICKHFYPEGALPK